jgi:hypothetical protein
MVRTADWCCPLLCCSEDRGPKRNLLTSQFLTPAELWQMLQHCYRRADRQGLMLAAMLALGVYNGFRQVAAWRLHALPAPPRSSWQLTWPVCRADDMSLCTYGLLACSAFSAQPCELKLLHAAIKGGKVTKAGEPLAGPMSDLLQWPARSPQCSARHAGLCMALHLALPALSTLRCAALLQASQVVLHHATCGPAAVRCDRCGRVPALGHLQGGPARAGPHPHQGPAPEADQAVLEGARQLQHGHALPPDGAHAD